MEETLYQLDPSQCALLVVDIQERLMPYIDGKEDVIKNSVLLIKAAKELNIPIVPTTQYVARIGNILPEINEELGELTQLDKFEFSCFGNDAITKSVKALPKEVNTLLVCGVETHICIYQTMLGGLMAGYRMWVAADAVSSRAPLNHQTGLDRIRQIGGVVGNTEMIIYELLHKAGTPEFKALLPFLK